MQRKTVVIAAMAAGVLAATPPLFASADDAAGAWRFRVLLDDREIGFHEFRVSHENSAKVVSSDARFDVKFFFLTAFSYRHQNEEVWSGDCLARVNAETDSNGKQTRVSGQRTGEEFLLTINEEAAQLPACVKTFAYWDPSIVEADRLLNVQTGQLEEVTASRIGADSVLHNGLAIDAIHYRLATNRGDISLWYSAADSRWLALEAPAKGGRTIRYEPLLLPPATGAQLSGRIQRGAGSEG